MKFILVVVLCATIAYGAPLEVNKAETPADLYQKYINIIRKVSESNGLSNLWLKYKESLQEQVDEWKNLCNSDASSELRWREALTTAQLVNEYLIVAEADCPRILSQIKEKATQEIAGFENLEREMEEAVFQQLNSLLKSLNNPRK